MLVQGRGQGRAPERRKHFGASPERRKHSASDTAWAPPCSQLRELCWFFAWIRRESESSLIRTTERRAPSPTTTGSAADLEQCPSCRHRSPRRPHEARAPVVAWPRLGRVHAAVAPSNAHRGETNRPPQPAGARRPATGANDGRRDPRRPQRRTRPSEPAAFPDYRASRSVQLEARHAGRAPLHVRRTRRTRSRYARWRSPPGNDPGRSAGPDQRLNPGSSNIDPSSR